jgi:hypothetical protein
VNACRRAFGVAPIHVTPAVTRNAIRFRDMIVGGEQLMRTDTAEKVLEKLATGDKATIVIERRTELKCELRGGTINENRHGRKSSRKTRDRRQGHHRDRAPDGAKMRVTSGSWVILRDSGAEVRKVDGRRHLASRGAKPAECEPPDRALRPVCSRPGRKRLRGRRSH